MRYTGDDFSSMGMELIDTNYQVVVDLAEQLLVTDTKEAMVNNIFLLYRCIGESFWEEDELMQNHFYPHYPVLAEAHSLMLDKLIELSYRLHKDKWRKRGMGSFVYHWKSPPIHKDDVDFEQYLEGLTAVGVS